MNTLNTTAARPDATQVAALTARAAAFDVSEITLRYMRTYEVPRGVAELHAAECKKYLTLCALFPGEGLGMKGPVDNYWHTFLLFTRQYGRFCQEIAGFFIHHVPNTSGRMGRTDGYGRTVQRYRAVFGADPDRRAWPRAERAPGGADCSDGPGPDDCSPGKDCGGGGEGCGTSE